VWRQVTTLLGIAVAAGVPVTRGRKGLLGVLVVVVAATHDVGIVGHPSLPPAVYRAANQAWVAMRPLTLAPAGTPAMRREPHCEQNKCHTCAVKIRRTLQHSTNLQDYASLRLEPTHFIHLPGDRWKDGRTWTACPFGRWRGAGGAPRRTPRRSPPSLPCWRQGAPPPRLWPIPPSTAWPV